MGGSLAARAEWPLALMVARQPEAQHHDKLAAGALSPARQPDAACRPQVCPTHPPQRLVLQREPHTRRASVFVTLALDALAPARQASQALPITIFIAAAANDDNPRIDASAPTTCRPPAPSSLSFPLASLARARRAPLSTHPRAHQLHLMRT